MTLRTPFTALLLIAVLTSQARANTSSRSDLERAMAELMEGRLQLSFGSGSIAGLNWYQRVSLDAELTVVVISRNMGGRLLCFDQDGRFKSAQDTDEILSVSIVHLLGDSWNLLLNSKEGFGTGVRYERFHLFARQGLRLAEVWSGDSYILEVRPGPPPRVADREIIGFVRVDEASAGFPGRLLHCLDKPNSPDRHCRLWEETKAGLIEQPIPDKRSIPSRLKQ